MEILVKRKKSKKRDRYLFVKSVEESSKGHLKLVFEDERADVIYLPGQWAGIERVQK